MLEDYAKVKDVVRLEKQFLPALQDVESKLVQFRVDAEIHNQIIRRYDEVISEKANKWNLREMREEMDKNFSKTQTLSMFEARVRDLSN